MSATVPPAGEGAPSAPWPSAAVSWYGVFVLTAIYVLSFIDRTILSLLVGPIRADLGLSDTEISLLHGFAFAIFYTTLGIPIALLADRLNRRNIIAIGVAFWSLATAACAFARSFSHLFVARICVGVGEAALSPAAYSLLADSFPPDAAQSRGRGLHRRRVRRLRARVPDRRRGRRRRHRRRTRPRCRSSANSSPGSWCSCSSGCRACRWRCGC